MASFATLQPSPLTQRLRIPAPLFSPLICRHGLFPLPCRAFKSSESDPSSKKPVKVQVKRKGALYSLKSLLLRTYGPHSWPDDQYKKAVEKAEDFFFSFATQFGRYCVTMMSTGVILLVGFQLSGGNSQLNELIWYSWLGGIIIGTMIGANMVLDEHSRAGPRNVVITGSTRGLGKALAREFLLSGDRVVITSRSPESVNTTVEELEESLKEGIAMAGSKGVDKFAQAKVVGIACDVCKPEDVRKLANFAVDELGSINIWINNAGTNKGFRPLLEFTDEDIQQIVSTNLVGSIICTKEAMSIMRSQSKGGHIFNMDGSGSGGSSTPLTAVYGSTKCGLKQLQASLLKECKRSKVGVHTASPGMVLTELLLSGSSLQNKQMFNIICELPETVARTLVPRMRVVKGSGKAIEYLTPPRILIALVSAWFRRGRWFDDQVNCIAQEKKWDINQLISLCVVEEERLKGGKKEFANLTEKNSFHKSLCPKKANFKPKWRKKKKATIEKRKYEPHIKTQGIKEFCCFYCGKPGHMVVDCRQNKEGKPRTNEGIEEQKKARPEDKLSLRNDKSIQSADVLLLACHFPSVKNRCRCC